MSRVLPLALLVLFSSLLVFLGRDPAAAHPPSASAAAQATPQSRGPQNQSRAVQQWQAIGLSFTRALDAQEKAYHEVHGSYEATMDLYRSGAMNGAMRGLARRFGIGEIRNWRWNFYVDTSPDGKEYQASVHGASTSTEMKCLPVFFSDQTGKVYEGKAIGCR